MVRKSDKMFNSKTKYQKNICNVRRNKRNKIAGIKPVKTRGERREIVFRYRKKMGYVEGYKNRDKEMRDKEMKEMMK